MVLFTGITAGYHRMSDAIRLSADLKVCLQLAARRHFLLETSQKILSALSSYLTDFCLQCTVFIFLTVTEI